MVVPDFLDDVRGTAAAAASLDFGLDNHLDSRSLDLAVVRAAAAGFDFGLDGHGTLRV